MDWTIPAATHIGRVQLQVQDLERMVRFYTDTIGLSTISRDTDQAIVGVNGQELLILEHAPDAAPRPGDAAGLFHLAIRFPTQAALGDALLRIEEAGALDGAADHGVSEALYLTDPEDNGIELYHDRPQHEWETDPDGMVQMPSRHLDLDRIRAAGTGASQAPDGTDIGHVHLEVTDLAAAHQFYVRTLGLTVRQRMDTALFMAAGGYHHHIGLNTWNHRSAPVSGQGLDWFELRVPDRATVTQLMERCQDAGHQTTTQDDGIRVDGPDGITVYIRPV